MLRGLVDIPTGAKRLIGVVVFAALAGCADSQITAPDAMLPTLVKSANVVVDPLDTLTETHTFDELSPRCQFGDTLPNPYEGLTFETTPYFGACPGPNPSADTTVTLIPSNPTTFGSVTELMIDLPRPAAAASLDVYDYLTTGNLTLNAYDDAGNLVDSVTDTTDLAWVTLSVKGDIRRLGIASDQGNTLIDNLSITFAPEATPATPDDGPANAAACKKGGWSDFGFKNQGQCIRFVETGKDSR